MCIRQVAQAVTQEDAKSWQEQKEQIEAKVSCRINLYPNIYVGRQMYTTFIYIVWPLLCCVQVRYSSEALRNVLNDKEQTQNKLMAVRLLVTRHFPALDGAQCIIACMVLLMPFAAAGAAGDADKIRCTCRGGATPVSRSPIIRGGSYPAIHHLR